MKKLLIPWLILLSACATTNPIPCPPPIVIRDTVKIVNHDTTTVFKITIDTLLVNKAQPGVIEVSDFGAHPDGTDASIGLNKAILFAIANQIPIVDLGESGKYTCLSPIIMENWNGSNYGFFSLTLRGRSNYWRASGYGTQLYFPNNQQFGIGIQGGKGVKIEDIEIAGNYNYVFPGVSAFLRASYASFTDGISRDKQYSPYSGIVVDPFSPTVPPDGGYPGLTQHYNWTMGKAGSTGIQVLNCFIHNFVIGFITSPNGVTENAELITLDKMQFADCKISVCGTQAQEKMNVIRDAGCWGTSWAFFATGLYGTAGEAGSWSIDGLNLAGWNQRIIWNQQQNYFLSYYNRIYAENVGSLGRILSVNGTKVTNSTLNFASPYDVGEYLNNMIEGNGFTMDGCQIRIYGTFKPVTINALNGPIFFRDCAFETVPFYNQFYPGGYCSFSNCITGNAYQRIGPTDIQTVTADFLTQTYAYGNTKINTPAGILTLESPFPAMAMPISQVAGTYPVTIMGTTATVALIRDEANRIKVGDVIVGSTDGSNNSVMGIVKSVTANIMTISYVPNDFFTGNYYLFIWLPLFNLNITADATAGSNVLTNVRDETGIEHFIQEGGLLQTQSISANTDNWHRNTFRIMAFDKVAKTITLDKILTTSGLGITIINTGGMLPQNFIISGTPGFAPINIKPINYEERRAKYKFFNGRVSR